MDRPHQTDALPLDIPTRRPPVWCVDCGTRLTDPDSRTARRGPACREKHGDRTVPRTDTHHVDQDTLPGA